MADTSSSHMPFVKKSVTQHPQSGEESSMAGFSSIHTTCSKLVQQIEEGVDRRSDRSGSDTLRTSEVPNQEVDREESDARGKDDHRNSRDDAYFEAIQSGETSRELPVTPRVPWRQGGVWHLGSNNRRDNEYLQEYWVYGNGTQNNRNQTDSDSGSVGGVPLYDEEFEDIVSELGLGPWREWLDLDGSTEEERGRANGPPAEPLYPQGLPENTECYVCFEETDLRRRLCCNFPVCDNCLESYLVVQVARANVNIECVNIKCNSYIHRSEISARLPVKYKLKFYKFLIDANVDPTMKTCPRCSSGLQVDKTTLKKRKVIKNGLSVICKRCGLEWCFNCHAPWHKGLSCKEYRKGDVLLKDWAREFHYGQLNAQQCPKCKIFIQRSLGCDHMTCSRCDTSFCYRCGENYRGIRFLGNHFSRLSPFGCRYNFMPDAPHMRRLIRGAVLGGKILGGLALSGFVVAAGACLLGIGVIALPALGGYKLHKRRRFRKRMRANRKFAKQHQALRLALAKQAAELSAPTLEPVQDSSDSPADDSSDEMRDRVFLGLQLPDYQRVEVLVHQSINSSSDQEEGGASGGTREVVTDSSVIVTDVQEVVNEDGTTTLVTNVYAKPKMVTQDAASKADNCDGSDDSDEEYYTDGGHSAETCSSSRSVVQHSTSEKSNTTSAKEKHVQSKNKPTDMSDDLHDSKEGVDGTRSKGARENSQQNPTMKAQQTKEGKEKDTAQKKETEKKSNEKDTSKEKKDKHSDKTDKNDKGLTEGGCCMEKKDKHIENLDKNEKKCPEKDRDVPSRKTGDQKDDNQLSKESTNGCFGNIFSKKITVIQIAGKRNPESQSEPQKPAPICYKAGTWEKSHEKSTSHKPKTSMDIRDLSHFREKLPLQPSDTSVRAGYDKGLLLQDFVVLAPPGDFSSEDDKGGDDSLSVASGSSVVDVGDVGLKEEEREGEHEREEQDSCCCLSARGSFRGSNLSCDIVTYL